MESYQEINKDTIDKWVEEGWEWGKPVSHEEYINAKNGSWNVLLTPTVFVPHEWFGSLKGKKILGLASGGGQQLICVGGRGWYQEAGKQAVPMTPGTVITIPANAKHWHDAASDSWFSHLAILIPGEQTSNEWCEKVSDEEYGKRAD